MAETWSSRKTAQARTRGAWHTCDTATVAWLLATLVLAAVTLVAFTHLHQLEPVATPWPYDADFARIADGSAPDRAAVESVDGWQVEGDRTCVTVTGGTLRLRNDDPEGGVGVRQLWHLAPGSPRTFRLSAMIASDSIQGIRNGFRVGEVTLVAGEDVERAFFHPLHRLAGLRGTRTEARYVEQFRFPAAAYRVELAMRLRHATGELRVSDLYLVALAERPWFGDLRLGLQLGWVAWRRPDAVRARGRSPRKCGGAGGGYTGWGDSPYDAGRHARFDPPRHR
jgi:hypothetical protein